MEESVSEKKSIQQLIDMIEAGKLVLPEFQRDFKWPIEKSAVLFDSIFQNLFIGSLIVSRPGFNLACKGFDLRPRGSRRHRPKPQEITAKEFASNDIYTLLDGQQRATSLYRAFTGVDEIYVVFNPLDDLRDPSKYDHLTGEVLAGMDECVAGFTTSEPKADEFYLLISDLYKGVDWRERRFLEEFVHDQIDGVAVQQGDRDMLEAYAIKLKADFSTDILKRVNLLSVQLLDMPLEKFCLYFERSNSQGLNLSFTDIITAKIYVDFKLPRAIDDSKRTLSFFDDKLVEHAVRYINFVTNGEVTKSSILKDLNGGHFALHWNEVVADLNYVQEWLLAEGWVFDVKKIPYRAMLLPLLSFYQKLPNKDFSQATSEQLNALRLWFLSSLIDQRYGGARHGSTNVVLKKDCATLGKLASGGVVSPDYWLSMRVELSFEELLKVDTSRNAKFCGLMYQKWFESRFKNLENQALVSFAKAVDFHHVIPDNYIKSTFGKDSDEYDRSDSVLNRIWINKVSNIKISDRAPSDYMAEMLSKNANLLGSLESHGISDGDTLIKGGFDDDFIGFLEMRFDALLPTIRNIEEALLAAQEGRSIGLL